MTNSLSTLAEVKEKSCGLIPFLIRDKLGRIIYVYGSIHGNTVVKNQTVSTLIKCYNPKKKRNGRHQLFIAESIGGSATHPDNLFPQLEYDDESVTKNICLDWILVFEQNFVMFEYFFKYSNASKIAMDYCLNIEKGNKITGKVETLIREGSDEIFKEAENFIPWITTDNLKCDKLSEAAQRNLKDEEQIESETFFARRLFDKFFKINKCSLAFLPGYGIIIVGILIVLAYFNFMKQ